MMGHGTILSISNEKKIDTKSLTEAEFYGVDDAMNQVLWTQYFLKHQGYGTRYTTLLQDNQAAMQMEKKVEEAMGDGRLIGDVSDVEEGNKRMV